ncbi:MAG: PhnD/SsuA/transferrin family substrate-binding protein [Thalassovita sp.]|nr:PhnD/SsuA/transferrin family substrate-binding protein [Thalassovita sp.]
MTAGFAFTIGTVCLSLLTVSADTADELVLGIHPCAPPSELIEQFEPLAGYQEGVLDVSVRVEISPDYTTHVDRIGQGELDIAYLGPASHVELVDRFGLQHTLARLSIGGQPTFKGSIVVRQDSPIRSLDQLRRRKMAFGDPVSTMSHLVRRHMLLQSGVAIKDLLAFAHFSNHDDVAMSVLMAEFNAGAVKEEVLEKYRKRGLRELRATPRISEHLFVARMGLPEPTVSEIRRALLGLHQVEAGPEILRHLKDTVPFQPREPGRSQNNIGHLAGQSRSALRKPGLKPISFPLIDGIVPRHGQS